MLTTSRMSTSELSVRSLAWRKAAAVYDLHRKTLSSTPSGFLSQHLIVLLDPKQIVPDMHAAYRRVRLHETAFGCFMMGPSATADVEATLVHGAQGARSLNPFFL